MSQSSEPVALKLRAERDDLARYLEDTEAVDWQTPSVTERARELCSAVSGELAEIATLTRFVQQEIQDSESVPAAPLVYRASQVLTHATGTSFAKSTLLIALLRARGIPAGFGYQRLRSGEPRRPFSLRGFVGVYLHERGGFEPLDPAASASARAEIFELSRSGDESRGESVCPLVFARPLPGILDVLARAGDVPRALRALPTDFPGREAGVG